MQELVQPSEGELNLRLDSHGGQDACTYRHGPLTGALQQRRLADACLAADDQCSAGIGKSIDKGVEEL